MSVARHTAYPSCLLASWSIPGLLFISRLTAAESSSPIQLRDASQQTGIHFIHTDGSSGRRYIVETVASGLATFDYDNDGRIDILFLNGAPLPGSPAMRTPPRNALYRNEGGWKFADVTRASGLVDTNYHLGVCVGDYNNDGYSDIYLNNFGPNTLYRNNGNGTFTDVTREVGVAVGNRVGAGACFLDMDGDGDLDLFVANYVGFTFENHRISHMNGFPAYVGPLHYPATSNVLFRNNGDGTFTDVSMGSGIASLLGAGMGVIAADIDNDGDTDVIVGNDLRPNFVLQNDGTGKFKEVGAALGLAYDSFGNVQGSMGVECADWNNDGWLDVYITPYQRQLATLYENRKGAYFDDVARQTGAAAGTYPHVKWGIGMIDLDNDGHRDLFIACGHLIDNVEQFDSTTSYNARNIVLRNTAQGRFVNVSELCGDGLLPKLSSRGAAFDDLDNDGDLDVVILNSRREPTILRNDSSKTNHWIQIQLRGTKSNRDGIGARVTVTAGDLSQIDEVHSGRSYQSDFGKRLHFGLGQRGAIEQIRVKWIGGGVDTVRNIGVDRLITLVEGRGLETPPAPAQLP
ncbi:MAG: CRTAC1 family protein [Verrucomicrobia bacterium]|nr:CRTAC1 family protein [Verrucomicrobiota bacterium]